ncbi:hypothetical protein HPG69_007685 [Diceros bicornis minor]|uniref:Uncharacterized protein n=1 Tax=Diceros bicornis minor TaxID=77932 RepID=A0A7J7EA59_DICBM|nr:hypothetical protein HPG69_007685 [Diceros bicornis minor]
MPSTGDSSSLFASTTPGPLVFLGPAAPMEGGNFGVCVSVHQRPHSVTGIQSTQLWGRTEGAPRTTPGPPFGQITWDLSGHSMASAVGGVSTIPEFGHISGSTLNLSTWGSPVQDTGGVVMGEDNSIPIIGGPSAPTFHQCT